MTVSIKFLPDAELEIEAAYDWYESRRPGLGILFLFALDAALIRAIENPRIFPTVARRTRKVLLRRFPYLVLYVVEGSRILITGVFHGHRDPGVWSDRIREKTTRYAAPRHPIPMTLQLDAERTASLNDRELFARCGRQVRSRPPRKREAEPTNQTPVFFTDPIVTTDRAVDRKDGAIVSAHVKLREGVADVRMVQPNPSVLVYFLMAADGLPVGISVHEPVSGIAACEIVDKLIEGPDGPEGVGTRTRNHFITADEIQAVMRGMRKSIEGLQAV